MRGASGYAFRARQWGARGMKMNIRRFQLLRPLDAFVIAACIALAIYVLAPELFGTGKTKDYPLWFSVGRQFLSGGPLYDTPAFLYPSFAAMLLAPLTLLGKIPFYVLLLLANAIALWFAVVLSMKLAHGDRPIPRSLEGIPLLVVLPMVAENFDLGQPNLGLLAIMLAGFLALRGGRPVLSGAAFALAAAVKVFPIAVLPYLIWRRHWRATASLLAFAVIFLLLLPAPFRGFDRNLSELDTWFVSMVGTEDGFGQREAQNWSWKNESVIALTHRLVRPVDYNADSPGRKPAYMNVLDLSYDQANLIVLAVFAALGLAFVAVMVPARRMTPRTYAEEIGILVCLMTIASPLARTYYFVWLLFPLTVLFQRILDEKRPAMRRWGIAAFVGVTVFMMLFGFDIALAYGTNTMAALLLAGALAVFMRNPAPDDHRAHA